MSSEKFGQIPEGEKMTRRGFLKGVAGAAALSALPNMSNAQETTSNREGILQLPTQAEFEAGILQHLEDTRYEPEATTVEKSLLGGLDMKMFLESLREIGSIDSSSDLYDEYDKLVGSLFKTQRVFLASLQDHAAFRIAGMSDHVGYELPDAAELINVRDELVNLVSQI